MRCGAGIPSPSKIAEANLRDCDGGPIFLALLPRSLRGKVERSNERRETYSEWIPDGRKPFGHYSHDLVTKRGAAIEERGERTVVFFVPLSDTIGIFPRRQR